MKIKKQLKKMKKYSKHILPTHLTPTGLKIFKTAETKFGKSVWNWPLAKVLKETNTPPNEAIRILLIAYREARYGVRSKYKVQRDLEVHYGLKQSKEEIKKFYKKK